MDNLYGVKLPPNYLVGGEVIDNLILWLHMFMVLLFVGWGIYMITALVKFRARPGHRASTEVVKGGLSKAIEIGVVIFEVVLLFGLSIPAWSQFKTNKPDADASINIRVVAQQFAWNIHYPGPDGVFGRTDPALIDPVTNPIGLDKDGDPDAADDIVAVNDLHFPVDRDVLIQLTSMDVIHSLFIPVLRIKQDAIPGMKIDVWFKAKSDAPRDGTFDIACAQLCGISHTTMKGQVTFETEESFRAWLDEQASADEEVFFDDDDDDDE